MVKFIFTIMIILFLSGCSGHKITIDEKPVWKDNDTKPIVEPEFYEPSLIWTNVERTGFDQTLELLDLDRNVRKIFGNMTESKNINSLDEIPNSSWFTNRHGYPTTRMTSLEIKQGVRLTPGPDTENNWQVFRPKVGGATVGFWIEDSRGDQYIIKFDPLGYPELATAAAAMGSRYFYACGYNTPQETIVYWKPEILTVRENATYKDINGNKHPLTIDYINKILENVERQPDGTIRSLASLNIGNVKGPFMYEGRKKGDENDWCPHEHRRELRALAVIGSLVNHYDLKDHNSMDVYIGEKDKGYLKHYLMDFGSTFGSDGKGIKIPRKGYANIVDLRDILVSTTTLGIKTWAWEYADSSIYPSIGYFESKLFEPDKFDPIIPNPAFEQLTDRDAYWGAKVVMSFSNEDLRSLVETGQYSDKEAADYLLKTLIERRDKIGKHWFSKLSPLDYFTTDLISDGIVLKFEDLALKYNFETDSKYRIKYMIAGKQYEEIFDGQSYLIPTSVLISEKQLKKIHIDLEIQVKRSDSKWLSPSKTVVIYDVTEKSVIIAGVEH